MNVLILIAEGLQKLLAFLVSSRVQVFGTSLLFGLKRFVITVTNSLMEGYFKVHPDPTKTRVYRSLTKSEPIYYS